MAIHHLDPAGTHGPLLLLTACSLFALTYFFQVYFAVTRAVLEHRYPLPITRLICSQIVTSVLDWLYFGNGFTNQSTTVFTVRCSLPFHSMHPALNKHHPLLFFPPNSTDFLMSFPCHFISFHATVRARRSAAARHILLHYCVTNKYDQIYNWLHH